MVGIFDTVDILDFRLSYIRRYTFLSRPCDHRYTDRVRHRAAPGAYKPHLAARVSQLSFSLFPFTSCALFPLPVSCCLYSTETPRCCSAVCPSALFFAPPSSPPTSSSGPAQCRRLPPAARSTPISPGIPNGVGGQREYHEALTVHVFIQLQQLGKARSH